MPIRLFVGNLPYDATEADIKAHFAPTGVASKVAIPLDRLTSRPRGFAFVDFDDPEVAKAVVRAFDAQPFRSRPLAVREARPREERPPMGGRPPDGGSGPSRGPDKSPGDGPRRMRAPPPPARRGGKAERAAPKGPIKVRTTGRFYADEDPDATDVDLDFDNFATSAPETDDDEVAENEVAENEVDTGGTGDVGTPVDTAAAGDKSGTDDDSA